MDRMAEEQKAGFLRTCGAAENGFFICGIVDT